MNLGNCQILILPSSQENEEYRQKVSSLSKILPEKETKIAANEQHLRQLKCRMKELENGRSNEVETLQTELKAVKDSHKTEIKELEMKLKVMKADAIKGQTRSKGEYIRRRLIHASSNSVDDHFTEVKSNVDKSTCTGNELEPVKLRHSTREQSTLTNDFYSIKDDPYPLFCSKCEVKLDPVPLDQILKQMSSCPKLITEVPSPSRRSG